MKPSPVGPGWLLFGIALVLRAGWIVYRWTTAGPALEYPDEELHWQLAANLVHDGVLISDDGRYAARMPIYPLFLAFFAGLDQVGILLARLGQAALGAATVLVAYRFAAAAFDRRVALVAGLLICCDPFAVFFANLLLTEVLFTFLAVSLTACAWQFLTHLRRHAALIGVALLGSVAILTRPSAAGWIPLLWLLLLALSATRRRAIVGLLACPVMLIMLVLPWGLRNQAVLGSWAWLSTNGGVTLYDAQGPQADGSSNQEFLHKMPELSGLDEVTLDQTLQRLALEQMRTDPGNVVRLAGVKFLRTWSPTPNVAAYRGGLVGLASAGFTLVVLVGAAIGLWRAVRSRWRLHSPSLRSLHALIWLPVVYFTLVHCVYIGSVRYRVPLMPFVELAAASACARAISVRSDTLTKD